MDIELKQSPDGDVVWRPVDPVAPEAPWITVQDERSVDHADTETWIPLISQQVPDLRQPSRYYAELCGRELGHVGAALMQLVNAIKAVYPSLADGDPSTVRLGVVRSHLTGAENILRRAAEYRARAEAAAYLLPIPQRDALVPRGITEVAAEAYGSDVSLHPS